MLSADSVAQLPVDNVKTEISVIAAENQTADPEGSEFKQPLQDATLSRKQRRVCLKRDRRKRKRQALAKLRGYDVVDQCENAEDRDDADEKAEEHRERLHQEWMEREKISQEEFRLKREREETAQRRKEEEEKRIKEEWEEQQRREREEQEQKQQEKRNRETNERMTGLLAYSSSEEDEAVQKMLDQAESQLENGSSWKNPDAPADYGTEKDKANCPFFLKTGACRFGDRCSRKHDHPVSSNTLMVRGMFVTFGMEQSRRDDYDTDASLEYSEEELHQQFLDFYEDVLPEFRNVGKVMQFKVSCNFEPHLRGNVYVQYENEDQCKEAFKKFNGRWYAGRQLQCEFSPVTRWKTAICGLFDRQKCPKGKHCNFLHVFRNPSNEFWEADRDLHLSPDRSGGFTGRHSERRDRMSQRNHSPGWSRYRWSSRRSHSRERQSRRRRRSRSRERRSRSRSRERRRSQFSLRRGNGRESLSRRSGSHEKRRSHSRGRDSDRQSRGRHSLTDSKWSSRRSESASPKDQSKDASLKRRSKSPKRADASGDANTSLHHHKHSKKSKKKKKNKKKHKRKRSKTHSVSSSAGSDDDDDGGDDETLKNRDKQNTDLPGEDVGTAENITSLQQDHAETRSNTFCQHEDEIHQTLVVVVTESSTAALFNENV